MKILVTGSAGFIGYHLIKSLLREGVMLVGIDNLNDYYDVNLKIARLKDCGIDFNDQNSTFITKDGSYEFHKMDLTNYDELENLFKKNRFDIVVNLAAQAGIRYSTENPRSYIKSNIEGFFNILECCKLYPPKKLLYASSSSVYGLNTSQPFATSDKTETPINIYAASKKSNELMAHAYSHLYGFPTIGLRFFTVYGPWGRPDMAPFLFADAIQNDRPINIFNNGEMERDFTFITDIINGIREVLQLQVEKGFNKVLNIGNGKPVNLMYFINCLENSFGKDVKKQFKKMIPGDIVSTWSDTTELKELTNYTPKIDIEQGVQEFVIWYKSYYS